MSSIDFITCLVGLVALMMVGIMSARLFFDSMRRKWYGFALGFSLFEIPTVYLIATCPLWKAIL